jgi:hypothetical protein
MDASRDWPRQATPFLCFAKERKQRKATAVRCPFGVPEPIRQEAGSAKTRLRLKHLRFCFRFPPDWFGSSQRNFEKQKQNPKNQKPKTKSNTASTSASVAMPLSLIPRRIVLRFGVVVKTPWDAAEKRRYKADQK